MRNARFTVSLFFNDTLSSFCGFGWKIRTKTSSSHFFLNYAFIFPRSCETFSQHTRFLLETFVERTGKKDSAPPTVSFDFQLHDSVFFFSRESARSELSISMRCKLVSSGYVYAGIFRLDAAWLAPLTEKIMRRRPPSFPWSRASVPRRDTDGRISKGTRAFHEVYGSIVQTFSFPPFYNSNESWLERV